MDKDKVRVSDRMLFLFSPKRAAERMNERLRKQGPDKKEMSGAATGYGNHGASRTINSMVGWLAGGGSAEDDVDLQGQVLRVRARDLYAGGGLARSGMNVLTTNVVGWGIKPKPKIDGEKLGMSDEACDAWERNTLREFELWADSQESDAERSKDFWSIQELAFLNMLMSGDVFVLFQNRKNGRAPYATCLRLIEADRVCTPDSSGDSEVTELDGGGRIVDGVEVDAIGQVVRYHIANRHPLMGNTSETVEWVAIEAYGKDTGEPNILHVMTYERPEQRRGVPFVAAQIETIKQLDRYINSELAANLVSAMLAAFLESDEDDGKAGMEDAVNEEEKVTHDELQLELAPGAIYDLPPGKHVKEINPIRSNSAFESFVTTLFTIIGASMEIPKEVLTHKYDSNYTAARSALLDFWKTVRKYRTKFNRRFNQPVYEAWLSEAVATGRIEAPGYFDDPAVKKAWCGCLWMGTSMGHVDPKKEIEAAKERIAQNISTQEQEAMEYNGGDWAANVRQRRKEITALNDLMPAEEDTSAKEEDEDE